MRLLVAAALLVLAGCRPNHDERKAAEPPAVTFEGARVTEASAKIAHGERLSWVLGCHGCHGENLEGQQFYELYASNLTREVPKYTDDQFERLLRNGIHPTGRDVWAMPSEIFQHLSDGDLEALNAYLRTVKPTGVPTGKALPFEPETRKLIAEGKLMPAFQFVEKTKREAPVYLGPNHDLGRYIARVTCAECHGPELEGLEGDTPDLIVAGGYSRDEFERLLTQGIPTGDRQLKELMQDVAKNRFSRLTPHERDALYAYLKARAERTQ
jgi:cytochrome c553